MRKTFNLDKFVRTRTTLKKFSEEELKYFGFERLYSRIEPIDPEECWARYTDTKIFESTTFSDVIKYQILMLILLTLIVIIWLFVSLKIVCIAGILDLIIFFWYRYTLDLAFTEYFGTEVKKLRK